MKNILFYEETLEQIDQLKLPVSNAFIDGKHHNE
jgi:hypothetical protein